MSNSPLVSYTKYSPNNSGKRAHSIDRISPHCVVGQCTIESLGGWFSQLSAKCSSNYGIGKDGRIGLFVDEANRSWCTSSSANDNRAVTIECASDTTHPYAMHECVFESLVKLCADICKRNGKTILIWWPDKNKSLNYAPKANEMIITVHRWFANKACPGDWLYNRLPELVQKVNILLAGSNPAPVNPAPKPADDLSDGTFMVRVKITDLNIRSGPGTSYSVVGTCPPGAYTIVQTQKVGTVDWGKLKSGAGWICLSYAERI